MCDLFKAILFDPNIEVKTGEEKRSQLKLIKFISKFMKKSDHQDEAGKFR